MSNLYANVIDVLNSSNVDYRRIVIELAKTSPSLFLKLHNGEKISKPQKPKSPLPSYKVREIQQLIRTNQTIPAIKALRGTGSLSLKDARDIIVVAAGKEFLSLDKDLQAYVNVLQKAL